MKVEKIGNCEQVWNTTHGIHSYQGWPTAERLKNGNIAVACSGFRTSHLCFFGKSVLGISSDEGKTFSTAAPVIDTVLDDRDAGLCAFGKSGLVVTSFNSSTEEMLQPWRMTADNRSENEQEYIRKYLDMISPEEEKAVLGSSFRISHDNGVTFGEIHYAGVTSPHGPIELKDGTVLWVGRPFFESDPDYGRACAEVINTETGEVTRIGRTEEIDNIITEEPYAVELPDGTIICHIRGVAKVGRVGIFTLYQTESKDGGRTWTKPHQILDNQGGAPSYMLYHSSGVLICTFGYRYPHDGNEFMGVRVMFSRDNGKTWTDEQYLYENTFSRDLGYPTTVELGDGSLLTVFYATEKGNCARIYKQHWRMTE